MMMMMPTFLSSLREAISTTSVLRDRIHREMFNQTHPNVTTPTPVPDHPSTSSHQMEERSLWQALVFLTTVFLVFLLLFMIVNAIKASFANQRDGWIFIRASSRSRPDSLPSYDKLFFSEDPPSYSEAVPETVRVPARLPEYGVRYHALPVDDYSSMDHLTMDPLTMDHLTADHSRVDHSSDHSAVGHPTLDHQSETRSTRF